MQTKILKPTKRNIVCCAHALQKGQLVGMPTETVYGLAANAFDQTAVTNIFVAKMRPQDNPLIVHVHKDYDLLRLVEQVTPLAQKLLAAFTPGPLTVVLKSNGAVCPAVSRGLSTVAIRIPSHKIAQKLLKECNLPLAAPSANLSSRMSATTALAVKEELGGKLPYILDGGTCDVGIESTVVDATGEVPIILRPGKITKEQILKVAQSVEEKTTYRPGEKVFSPGVKYKHYSPSIPVFVCPYQNYEVANRVLQQMKSEGLKPIVLCQSADQTHFNKMPVYDMGSGSAAVAKQLYAALRFAEKKYSAAVLMAVASGGMGTAVLNRMSKMNSYQAK